MIITAAFNFHFSFATKISDCDRKVAMEMGFGK